MDPDPPSPNPSPRKVRFAPKAPARRTVKPAQPKSETVDDDNTIDEEAAKARLLHRVNEHLGKRGPRVEKKSAVRVAFSHGAASTTPLRTFGIPREENDENMYTTKLEESAGQIVVSSSSTVEADADESGCSSSPVIASSPRKNKKEYIEPWDYHHSYYPTVLPLRRPYSGDPELLDEEEFGEAAEKLVFDENAINAASRLGLLEETEEAQMLFLQLPPKLPIDKQGRAPGEKGKEKVGSSISLMDTKVSAGNGKKIAGSSTKDCWLEDLSAGYMGKMLVYKSGAVKLKLGENLYNVSPGHENTFAQDLMAINLPDKDCCRIGELEKRAVVSIEYDWLSDHENDCAEACNWSCGRTTGK